MMKKIYSFDIFDTCLIRSCGHPQNILDILTFNILGKNTDKEILADFALERKKVRKELDGKQKRKM